MRSLKDALAALERNDIAAWDRILETSFVPALDKAIADLEALKASEEQLSKVAQPTLGTSGPLELRPLVDPITVTVGILAIGAAIGTYQKIKGYFTQQQAASADCIEKRMRELREVYGAFNDIALRDHATKLCEESKYRSGVEAVGKAGETIVSEGAEQVAETLVGRLPVGKVIRGAGAIRAARGAAKAPFVVKDALETGELIGSSVSCPDPSTTAPKSGGGLKLRDVGDSGSCAVYIGKSTTDGFADVPEGDWNLTLYQPNYERSSAANVKVRAGEITNVVFNGKRLGESPAAAAEEAPACNDAKAHMCGKLPSLSCNSAIMDNAIAKLEAECGKDKANAYRAEAESACRSGSLKCEFGPAPACTGGTETKYDYSGRMEADGRSASLKLTFSGASVTGELLGNAVCANNIRLPRTQVRFTGALRGTWEGADGAIMATWAGGDYGCEGGLVPYFPTTGNVTIRKVGSEIELRRIAGGGRYVFPASSRTYTPACP